MNKSKLLFLMPILLCFLSAKCKKDSENPNQLSLLPPATQTGANTFGCLVNGQAFIPKNQNILTAPILGCQYGNDVGGGYSFEAVGGNKHSDGSITEVFVRTDTIAMITEGVPINFKTNSAGNASASYFIFSAGQLNHSLYQYDTNNVVSGQLIITKVDLVNQFVSGTFYFNAVNGANDTVKVTNGRFDLRLN